MYHAISSLRKSIPQSLPGKRKVRMLKAAERPCVERRDPGKSPLLLSARGDILNLESVVRIDLGHASTSRKSRKSQHPSPISSPQKSRIRRLTLD